MKTREQNGNGEFCYRGGSYSVYAETSQDQSWKVLEEIRSCIEEGMTEIEAHQLALSIFRDYGVSKHWHKPFIRFGAGTTLTFHQPLQAYYRLEYGDPFFIDVGPVWNFSSPDSEIKLEIEGDVGNTFVLGENDSIQSCIEFVRSLFEIGRNAWLNAGLSGQQIYELLDVKAHEKGFHLLTEMDGHRLSDFPHHKYTKERLAQISSCPADGDWVLELQVVDPVLQVGAFFEDLLVSG